MCVTCTVTACPQHPAVCNAPWTLQALQARLQSVDVPGTRLGCALQHSRFPFHTTPASVLPTVWLPRTQPSGIMTLKLSVHVRTACKPPPLLVTIPPHVTDEQSNVTHTLGTCFPSFVVTLNTLNTWPSSFSCCAELTLMPYCTRLEPRAANRGSPCPRPSTCTQVRVGNQGHSSVTHKSPSPSSSPSPLACPEGSRQFTARHSTPPHHHKHQLRQGSPTLAQQTNHHLQTTHTAMQNLLHLRPKTLRTLMSV